jgi:AraC family transcriptional regulator
METYSYETYHRQNDCLPTHRHSRAYVALVLDGGYFEGSVDGPFDCPPGTLVVHPPFHAHGDRFGSAGARVLNVLLDDRNRGDAARTLRVASLREARRLLKRHPHRIDEVVAVATAVPMPPLPAWHREFMRVLREGDEPIGRTAARIGISAEHVSRDLLRWYGMSPRALKLEWRSRRALRLLITQERLADIAAECGFADQSHLTRTIRAVTGLPPSRWRRHIKWVQDREARALAQ